MPINWSNFVTRNAVTGAFRTLTPQLLAETYLVPKACPIDLDEVIKTHDGPWSASFTVAPTETRYVVERALRSLMGATTNLAPETIDLDLLSDGRAKRHLSGLISLWQNMEALPEDLHIVGHVLETKAFIEDLPILDLPARGFQSSLEKALFEKLAGDHGLLGEPHIEEFRPSIKSASRNSLGALQAGILEPDALPVPLDDTLRVFGVRDVAEEADLAAGIIRREVDNGAQLSDFAIILPNADYGIAHFRSAFDRAGILLSGLPEEGVRDISMETLRLCVLALRKPSPPMVMASLCLSPLMAWSTSEGRKMARSLMDRGFSKDIPKEFSDLFKSSPRSGDQLMAILGKVSKQVDDIKDILSIIGAICSKSPTSEPDWASILSALERGREVADPVKKWVEGVTLSIANTELWRTTKHLIIAGFVGDAYPKAPGTNAMFLDSELLEIFKACRLHMPTYKDVLQDRLDLFARQIQGASESITFLTTYRDLAGSSLAPATGMSLVHRTIKDKDNLTDLVVDLSNVDPDSWPCEADKVAQLPHEAPILPENGVIELDEDLFLLRETDEKHMKPQSPSRLETLMVSPLAWVMKELYLEADDWAPEELNLLNQGSLFHSVLENLFEPDKVIPTKEVITETLPHIFARSISLIVPFVTEPMWAVERANLESDAFKMALRWREILLKTGAKILANELHLQGEALGLRMQGFVDTILEFPNGQKVVVDFKTSKSDKRRQRMEAGWDLQIELYRKMLLRPEEGAIDSIIGKGTSPAIAYHLLRDGGTLAQGDGIEQGVGIELLENNISEYAMVQLTKKIAEVGAGKIVLNVEGDATFFEKTAKLPPYALLDNPLIAAFTMHVREAKDE